MRSFSCRGPLHPNAKLRLCRRSLSHAATAGGPGHSGANSNDPYGGRCWSAIPYWCSLCCEPVNSWNEHRGKREHICLDMFYNALVHYERRWDPKALWCEVDEDAGSGFCLSGGRVRSARRQRQPRWGQRHEIEDTLPLGPGHGSNAKKAMGDQTWTPPMINARGGLMDTSASSPHFSLGGGYYQNPMTVFQAGFDKMEPVQRRAELTGLLRVLIDENILVLSPNNLHTCSFAGSLVLFKELFQPLSNLFPFADAKEVSALTQMVAATFNSETVFDLCQFGRLVPDDIAQSRQVMQGLQGSDSGAADRAEEDGGEGALSSPPPASVGLSGEVGYEGSPPAATEGTAGRSVSSGCPYITIPNANVKTSFPFHFKGVFCRAILGALRWSLEPDTLLPPPALLRSRASHRSTHPSKATLAGASRETKDLEFFGVLAAHACRLLIAEMTHCKVAEYVVRVEGVFREEHVGLAEAAAYRFLNCDVYRSPSATSAAADAAVRQHADSRATLRTSRRRRSTSAESAVSPPGTVAAKYPVTWDRLAQKADAQSTENPFVVRARGRAFLRSRHEVVPPSFHWGMLQYCDGGRFFNEGLRPDAPLGAASRKHDSTR